ncbi:MAG: zinc ribbon domain-containing protein [Butyrivibrio sp.]|uniref:zinc ribbon domain-containing protein n=1 Tax=Butyrivibrio sp. TaxID=28121 RepID=UPI0025F9D71A|nr:zinc ribbon domain-containing protein [Butyrivibrio sp.]MCR5771074.1 zinc ribbon domain-containing protein [Butyrivibrio sp.]
MALDYYIPGTRGGFPNRILLVKTDEKLSMKLDITLFPLYCDGCGHFFSHFYIHKGSRKGVVGQITCPSCGRDVQVTDEGSMVDSVCINDHPVNFSSLYLLDFTFIEEADRLHDGQIIKALMAKYNKSELNYLTIDELTNICSASSCVQLTGDMKFQTDTRFAALPPDINRWIEFLYRSGVNLPSYVTILKSDHDIPSLEGSAIWRMRNLDKLISQFPSRRKTVFDTEKEVIKRLKEHKKKN